MSAVMLTSKPDSNTISVSSVRLCNVGIWFFVGSFFRGGGGCEDLVDLHITEEQQHINKTFGLFLF